jgi:hypothetical protein
LPPSPATTAEYDHVTPDEAIQEGIIINEYTFTEGGWRFGWRRRDCRSG